MNMTNLSRIGSTLVLGCLTLSVAQAQPSPAKSQISITFKQMGVPVDADFKKVSASVQYDPARPSAATAQFSIDIASFDLGSPEYNKEVLKPQWFDAARYPTATFTSTGMKVLSPTQLEASGKLTIKGKTQEIRIPVTVKNLGDTTTFDTTLRIQRTAFQIGTGEWQDTSLVADEVVIRVQAQTRTVK